MIWWSNLNNTNKIWWILQTLNPIKILKKLSPLDKINLKKMSKIKKMLPVPHLKTGNVTLIKKEENQLI